MTLLRHLHHEWKEFNIDKGQKQLKYYAVDSLVDAITDRISGSEKISYNGVDKSQSSLTETLELKSDFLIVCT